MLILGSRLLVTGSVSLARSIVVSEAVIGLTIIAGGTSLPELATSLVAAIRKLPDLAIGNIVDSNIFNILCILGASSLAAPLVTTGIRTLDIYVMVGTSLVLLPFLLSEYILARWEGAILLGMYLTYLYLLWLY